MDDDLVEKTKRSNLNARVENYGYMKIFAYARLTLHVSCFAVFASIDS